MAPGGETTILRSAEGRIKAGRVLSSHVIYHGLMDVTAGMATAIRTAAAPGVEPTII